MSVNCAWRVMGVPTVPAPGAIRSMDVGIRVAVTVSVKLVA